MIYIFLMRYRYMRDALRFMLATMSDSLNFEYWCKLNEYIARNEALEWGKLRTGSVGISGTDYLPPVPAEDQTRAELNAILSAATTATTKALEAFVWGTRGQFFLDGNKRTSMTLANKILISAGAGFLTITDRHMEQFNTLLVDYYNTGESEALKDFLYKNAIQGIFQKAKPPKLLKVVLTSIHLLLLGLYAFFLNQFACRLAAFISIGCRQPDADTALVDLEP